MKRILLSTAIAIVSFVLNPSVAQVKGTVPVSACTTIGEDFKTDPLPRGYLIQNFDWVGHQTSGQSLRTWAALPNTSYVITTPVLSLATHGSIRMGFKVQTSPGSNNYFATGGFIATVQVLDENNNVIVSNTQSFFSAGIYCYQLVSTSLVQGMPVRYKYILNSTEAIDGTRIVDFDDLTFNGMDQVILPVNFMNITGKATPGGNLVSWQVTEEVNLSHYEIEKSTNGVNFNKAGEVYATGAKTYSFTDRIIPSSAFYRVRSIDRDGSSKISPVVSLKSGEEGKISIRLFPSPAANELNIQHGSGTGKISIHSSDGRLLKSIAVAERSIQTQVNISPLEPGMYIVTLLQQDGHSVSARFIKQ